MAEEGFKRKLTAILSADVVGYSRLMEDNEEATIQTLNTYRNSMSTLIEQHRGRVVDMTGDNLMAEFSSVVDAVKCAVETQKEIIERNADLAENRRMFFRIGVNLGDIVEEDDRIYGDGVNIAARLEGMAEGGGICISGTAYDQLKNKLELGYEYLGEHSVKNIAAPVRVYKVLMEPEAVGKIIGEKRKTKRWIAVAAAVIILIGLAGWYLYIEQSKRIETAAVEKMAFPLPEKPSIAVLAFDNLSGDPEQEYFSDGIAENIITVLSKVGKLFVIARNSSFTYKGKPVKVQQISQELGVRYVLEGSVQKSGDRVRITAQLIDAIKGQHLWAEKYDRDFKDLFEIQDDITVNVAFQSRATNLIPGDTMLGDDIFVHDRQTGTTEIVSVASYGSQGNESSWSPSISAGGRFIAFWSYATNLVPDDTNGSTDIFVHDRQTGTTERVSIASDGSQSDDTSVNQMLSADGRYVAFASWATNVVPGDTNYYADVFVAPNPLF